MATSLTCPLCQGDCHTSESYSMSHIFSWWGEHGHSLSQKVLNQYRDVDQTTLFTCGNCGFGIFMPTVVGTSEFYQELSGAGLGSYYSRETWEHRQALNDLKEYRRILEVGSGAGYFLESLKQQGKEVQGVELNAAAAAFARQRQVPVEAASIENFAAEHRDMFEAVCLFQVIEHVAAPLDFLGHALTCLKSAGRLILSVPNMAGILGKMDPLVTNVPPHHVTRWTPEALGLLTRHFPLELVALKYEPAYDFLRPYFRGRLQRGKVPEWAAKQIWRLGLSLPIKLLRRVKPGGLKSLPGHTVYALFRKK
jgi:2-polyprenyl-3-methyl-5-hydroxy-6-metoxy-1,4-benzoquinol methylase